jgi:hypothetical protein
MPDSIRIRYNSNTRTNRGFLLSPWFCPDASRQYAAMILLPGRRKSFFKFKRVKKYGKNIGMILKRG